MKVLYLTKYSRKGASSRLRSYQYFPFLEKEGFEITVRPLFNDKYLENLYDGKKSIFNIALAYLKRFLILFTIKKYDKIIIEKELFPFMPSVFERLINIVGVEYVVDYDDAIFHNYDLSKNKVIRFLLKSKIDYVMKWSCCVIAGNSYLADRAKVAGAKKIVIIPTVIDIEKYKIIKNSRSSELVIGWIGSPSTFKYVKCIEEALKKVVENYKVKIHIVGANGKLDLGETVKYIDWSEETEVLEIQKFDIGIMPLENTAWELGKCSYKLIQYMGCGVPVIASPIGMNKEVIKHKWNGFLAKTNEDWFGFMKKLISESTLRKEFGLNGKDLVEDNYIIGAVFEKYKSSITT